MDCKQTTPTGKADGVGRAGIDFQVIKDAARGRWAEILPAVAGVAPELLDGRHHPCPKCGGEDRFRFSDLKGDGSIICNGCGRTGDGIATVAKLLDIGQGEAARQVAAAVGINGHASVGEPLEAVARVKGLSPESLRAYGAQVVADHIELPAFGPDGSQCSTFRIWATGSELQRKGLSEKGKRAGVFLPVAEGSPRLPKAGETWYLVEGAKDAAALGRLGLLAMGAPTCQLSQKFAPLLRGCRVVLIPDRDSAGNEGAEKTAARLYGVAELVCIATLPAEIVEAGGADVRDVLRQPAGEAALREALDNARPWKPPTGLTETDGPQVFIRLDEGTTARETIAGLGEGIYQRAGELVHIVEDATPCRSVSVADGALRVRALAAPILRERISERVRLLRMTNEGPEPVRPPGWLVGAIHQRGEWPAEHVPPLTGIVRSPTLRQDYSVLQSPGYDRLTGLYYAPDGTFPPVPDSPTVEDARRAAVELLESVCDFPFMVAESEDHRTAWLAYVLMLAGRPAISGPCPLIVFDAPAAGSGKSLLADVGNLIVFGDVAARYSWSGDDAELRKTITSVALEALPAVLLDNLDGDIRSAALDAALTGTTWRDRVLGKSETTGALPLATVWAATGNNVQLSGDTSRRALFCRLEPDADDPEARTGFRHEDLTGWTRANRHRLAVAAVTILRAYAAAGRPQVKLAPWGSYEGWTSLVRQSVVWLGMTDPAATRRLAREADRTREIHRLLLDGIEAADNGEGLTSAEIVKRSGDPDLYPVLAEAVAEICGPKPDSRRVGNRLKRYRGRRNEGRQLTSIAGHAGTTKWYVSDVHGGSGRSGESVSIDLTRESDPFEMAPQENVSGLGSESPEPLESPMQRQRGVI